MRWVLATALMVAAGCDLREITLADAHDVIVAEIVLRAGETVQTAYLHRTSSGIGSARVFNARVEVSSEGVGRPIVFEADADSLCLKPAPVVPLPSTGTCYVAHGGADMVRAGERYRLRIELPDGRVLTGETTVPAAFEVLAPAAPFCELEPGTLLELTWSEAAGAAVYLVEARMHGLREAVRATGTPVGGTGPVELTGLAITSADTTLVFPSELGLFDRFDDTFHPLLLAIRSGLPVGVRVELAFAAADHNYVNWVRGGAFNPSGSVRISSIGGAGAGVFGAVVVVRRELSTAPGQDAPRCQ
jgi:hypothetical protein